MKIPTKIHGMLDYPVGLLFLGIPFILNLDSDTIQAKVFLYLGIATIVYSLLTRYELGLVKALPMKAHLAIDIMSGIFLSMSPWLFGFSDSIYLPYLILGLFEIVVASMSSYEPEVKRIVN